MMIETNSVDLILLFLHNNVVIDLNAHIISDIVGQGLAPAAISVFEIKI